jgi:prolipoprotein diacylglyceryltransferase
MALAIDSRMPLLDRLVRHEVAIHRHSVPPFRLCGIAGFFLAAVICFAVAAEQGLSPALVLLLLVTAIATFLGQAIATKYVSRTERYVYYRHEIAVIAVAALLLGALQISALSYLDITVVGLGVFLACGRCGCFLAGCCHGRPNRWGVRYENRHGAMPRHLLGVRLFPLQLAESAVMLFITSIAIYLVLNRAPGAGFAWYTIAYGSWRFSAEFLRGDINRPYAAGFSEAQWTSLILMSAVCAAEMAGTLPLNTWHLAATVALAGSMAAISITHGHTRRLFLPPHVREMKAIIESAPQDVVISESPQVAQTSLGLRISASTVRRQGGEFDVLAVSRRDVPLSESTAERLALLIVQLRYGARGAAPQILKGGNGVYHIVVPAVGSAHGV